MFSSPTYRHWIPDDRRCKTRSRRAFARRVDSNGGDLLHKLQQLGLGCTRVTQQEQVDISSPGQAIREQLAWPAKQKAGNGLLNVLEAVNTRGNAARDSLIHIFRLGKLLEFLFLCGWDGDARGVPSALLIRLDAHGPQVRGSDTHSDLVTGTSLLEQEEKC